jgi:hypothetical protein
MRKRAAAALAAIWMLLAPGAAQACWGPGRAYLHKVLPGWIPADAIVAEVEFDTAFFELLPNFDTPLRARVRRMIQGAYSGATLLVRHQTDCDSPFGNGMSGFLIGRPDGMDNGVLVVVPMAAPERVFDLRTGPLPLRGR